jgi:cytochrome c oxidase subunit 2
MQRTSGWSGGTEAANPTLGTDPQVGCTNTDGATIPPATKRSAPGGLVKKSWIPVFLLWLLFTVLGVILVANTSVMPAKFSHEAEVIDEAYELLEVLAVPVMALVFAIMVWGAIAWRSSGAEREDGPPQRNSKAVMITWLIITVSLAIGVVINPGFVGLAAVRGEPVSDYVVEIEAAQFFWKITYPNGATAFDELVVPVDKRVRYAVNSTDVLHSFWIPAFRTKIDAVPGLTTQVYITATHTGTIEDDINLRIQCAELCGAGHAQMAMPVRVVDDAEWNEYIKAIATDG